MLQDVTQLLLVARCPPRIEFGPPLRIVHVLFCAYVAHLARAGGDFLLRWINPRHRALGAGGASWGRSTLPQHIFKAKRLVHHSPWPRPCVAEKGFGNMFVWCCAAAAHFVCHDSVLIRFTCCLSWFFGAAVKAKAQDEAN